MAARSLHIASHVQQNAHLTDTRAAIGRRHLLYDLERHPLEASPLTQFFVTLSKRRPSWWAQEQAEQQQQQASVTPVGKRSPNRTRSPNASAGPGSRAASPAMTMASLDASTDETGSNAGGVDPDALAPIPDTVVWENNIPKGWYYFDPKEGHVLRRKVETKAIMSSFLKNAKYADDVVAVMYTAVGQCDTGEPAVEYHFISAAALESFLFENGRGKGTSILQAFVPSLHASHNDTLEVIWSPTLFHVNRRQNIHEIADDRVDLNDRCITFEGKTHLSRLVQCTSRLRHSVKRAVVNFVKHFHETDSRHVITRFVGRFKMNADSQLVFLNCVSVRIMRAASTAVGPNAPKVALAFAATKSDGGGRASTPGAGRSKERGDLSFDDGLRTAFTVAAPDGGGSAFHKQFRVAVDLAVHYDLRKPPAVNKEHRSVLARLQERAEEQRDSEWRSRPREPHLLDTPGDDDSGVGPGSKGQTDSTKKPPPRADSQSLGRTISGIDPDTWMNKMTKRRQPSGGPGSQRPEPMLGTHKASRHGFVVRPVRGDLDVGSGSQMLSPGGTASSFIGHATSSLAAQGSGGMTVDSAVSALVMSGEFANVASATPEQQQRVCRVLDKCVRKAGISGVRRALLQAHEDDLTDAERMELLALLLGPRAGHASTASPGTRAPSVAALPAQVSFQSPAPQTGDRGAMDAWGLVSQTVVDAAYEIASAADGSQFARATLARRTGAVQSVISSRFWTEHEQRSHAALQRTPLEWRELLLDALVEHCDAASRGLPGVFESATEWAAAIIVTAIVSAPSCTLLVPRLHLRVAPDAIEVSIHLGSEPHDADRRSADSRCTPVHFGQRVDFAAKGIIADLRHYDLVIQSQHVHGRAPLNLQPPATAGWSEASVHQRGEMTAPCTPTKEGDTANVMVGSPSSPKDYDDDEFDEIEAEA